MTGKGLFENYARELAAAIDCRDLRHKSARFPAGLRDGHDLFLHLYYDLKLALDTAMAGPLYRYSAENFRWFKLQLSISDTNKSPEVTLERALVQACCRLGRCDWTNQVPLVSGIAGPRAYKRRAIDLVRKVSDREFEFVELKIASDSPLYAAAEIVLYGLLWLHATGRGVQSSDPQSPLLDARIIKLSVLAPRSFYRQSDIDAMSTFFNSGLAAVTLGHSVDMSFRFTAFPENFTWPAALSVSQIVRLLDDRRPV